MKVFKFLVISLFISYISSLNNEENAINVDIKNFESKEVSQDQSTVIPLTLLTEEINLFQNYIIATLDDEEVFATPNCLFDLQNIFRNYSLATVKLIHDSSHSFSKLGSYRDCKYKIYYDSTNNSITSDNLNYSYVLFHTPFSSFNQKSSLFSLCVPKTKDCKETDYVNILQSFNMKTEFIDTTQLGGTIAYILNKDDDKENLNFIGIIVISFFGFFLLCEIFPCIPVNLFKCCFKKKIISEGKIKSKKTKNKKIEIYEISNLSSLEKSFDLKESIGEIYGVESNAGINNDSGISFLKGLRGICLMLYILGETLQQIYQYPVKRSEKSGFFNEITLSFIFFFNRFTKNLFLSISSFSLCYKILCYFDNEIEKNELKNINIKIIEDFNQISIETSKLEKSEESLEIQMKKNKKLDDSQKIKDKINPDSPDTSKSSESNCLKNNLSNTGISPNMSNNISKVGKKSFSSSDLSKMPTISQINNTYILDSKLYNKITFKSFFVFIFRQFYKYFLFVSIFLIFRFSYYDFASKGENPMWEFIKNSFIKKINKGQILAIIFLYLPFYAEANNGFLSDPYDIVILEISLFIVCSIILFAIYKTNIRFDIYLLIMIYFGILIKIVIYSLIQKFNTSVYADYFYPSKGFVNNEWRFIFNNIFYYIPCISIGLFFGLVNYAIQKSAKKISQFRSKIYLSIPISFVNILRKRPYQFSFFFSFIFITIFIWCGLSYYFLFMNITDLNEDSLAKSFYENHYINIYYSIDIDIIVLFIFLAIIPFNLMGENNIINFLKHEYWNILSKPYYSYMLIIQLNGINTLYRMNTNVSLDIYSITFFSITNFIFGILIGALLYTFFEVPFKKLNKFIMSKNDDNKIEEDIEEFENIDDDENKIDKDDDEHQLFAKEE
jgi:hypothetical protein